RSAAPPQNDPAPSETELKSVATAIPSTCAFVYTLPGSPPWRSFEPSETHSASVRRRIWVSRRIFRPAVLPRQPRLQAARQPEGDRGFPRSPSPTVSIGYPLSP